MERGPILIVESMPEHATAAIGAWVCSGSAHEPVERAGITHLVEHLLLRRCGRRGPEEIAELIDSLGGGVDAFTTRESCAITAHVPADRLAEASSLVMDALFSPRFLAREVELERQVALAEFDLVQDSPGEMVMERSLQAAWGTSPLARPVLGDRDAVRRLRAADLRAFHRNRFTAERLLLVVAGPVREAQVRDLLAHLPRGASGGASVSAPRWHAGFAVEEREGLEQVYANLVLPALPAGHPERMTLGVLHQLLGAGTSSRLFRELRDRRGLVYEVETAVDATSAAGVLDIVFSTPGRKAPQCWKAVLEVLADVGRGNISDHEVEIARQALAAGIVLGTEGPDALVEAHAGEFLARGRRFDAAALRRELDGVTPDGVRSLARRLVRLELLAGAVCGPKGAMALPEELARRVA
jgi:predicted Zn-dependent peptidase